MFKVIWSLQSQVPFIIVLRHVFLKVRFLSCLILRIFVCVNASFSKAALLLFLSAVQGFKFYQQKLSTLLGSPLIFFYY
jgi:hypothetical protein